MTAITLTLTIDQMVEASTELHRRINAALQVVSNVAAKTRPEFLPAAFEALLRGRRSDVHVEAGFVRVRFERRFGHVQDFLLPVELLTRPDRDAAQWAREQINAYREDAYKRLRRSLEADILLAERRVRQEQARLEEKQRRLANLTSPNLKGRARKQARAVPVPASTP